MGEQRNASAMWSWPPIAVSWAAKAAVVYVEG